MMRQRAHDRLSSRFGFILRRKVLKETLWAYVGKGTALLFGLGYTVILARMGPQRYGLYVLCVALGTLITTALDLGISTATARYLSLHLSEPKRRLISRILADALSLRATALGLGLVVFFFCFDPIVAATGHPELSRYKLVILGFVLALTACQGTKLTFTGLHRQSPATLVVLTEHTLKLLLVVALSLVGLTVLSSLLAMTAAMGAAAVVGLVIIVTRFFHIEDYRATGTGFRKALFLFSLPMALVVWNNALLSRFDMILVGKWGSELQLGYYALAKELALYLVVIVTPVMMGANPRFGAACADNRQELLRLHLQVNGAVAAILVPACVLGSVFAPFIIECFFGREYVPAVPTLRTLFAWSLAYGIARLNLAILIYLGRALLVCGLALGCVVLTIGLNYVLIPRYGALGAAMAAVVSQLPAVTVGWLAVRWDLRRRR